MGHIHKFNSDKQEVQSQKDKLKLLEQELQVLSEQPRNTMNDSQLEHYFQVQEEIDSLRKNIQEIETNYHENNYYLETGHLMFHYYDKFKNQGSNSSNNYYRKQDSKQRR